VVGKLIEILDFLGAY